MGEENYEIAERLGRPPQLWRSSLRLKATGHGPPLGFSRREVMELHTVIPDAGLHRHVARIVTSNAGTHVAILTTSGQTLQFHQDSPALNGERATKAMVAVPPNVDAQGLTLVRSHYQGRGLDLAATELPFDKSWTDEAEKRRIGKLWKEIQRQSAPGLVERLFRRPRGRSPGPA